jgi:hypothetical protein
MLAIPGSPIRTCEGVTRREWLRVGALGSFGLGLPSLLASPAQAAGGPSPRTFGRAKSCIVLFMFGAPAHQDCWDLKPLAPAEVRGEFRPVATNVTGLQVSEHLPRLAQRADRYALVRSLTHPDNTHTVAMHYMLTGVRHARPATNPQNAADDFPCFGAMMNFLAEGKRARTAPRGNAIGLPAAVSLNAPANQVSANNHIFPGFFAGFLGSPFDPVFVPQNANAKDFRALPPPASGDRLPVRRQLLADLEQLNVMASGGRQPLDTLAKPTDAPLHQGAYAPRSPSGAARSPIRSLDQYYAQAFDLLTSPGTRRAFELSHEPARLREAYGDTPFGQGCLLARRLVEAGVRLVTVNWERDDAFWDTHQDNFGQHKNKLLPNLDRGFSALLDDLAERGLLDETLIVWLGEFGRTPAINKAAGRDHWAACNTVLLAGAGIRGGTVYGASDRTAAYPAKDPVGPEDLAATIYHLLGVDLETRITGPLGRPVSLSEGRPIWGIM